MLGGGGNFLTLHPNKVQFKQNQYSKFYIMNNSNHQRTKSGNSVKYMAPQIFTVEFAPEGVICFSTQQMEQYDYLEFTWE